MITHFLGGVKSVKFGSVTKSYYFSGSSFETSTKDNSPCLVSLWQVKVLLFMFHSRIFHPVSNHTRRRQTRPLAWSTYTGSVSVSRHWTWSQDCGPNNTILYLLKTKQEFEKINSLFQYIQCLSLKKLDSSTHINYMAPLGAVGTLHL